MVFHCSAGGHVYLLTLTTPHERDLRLVDFERQFAKTLQRLKNSKALKSFSKEYQRAGSVRSLEITWSTAHGFHVHTHDLVFAKPGLESDSATIDALRQRWIGNGSTARRRCACSRKRNGGCTGSRECRPISCSRCCRFTWLRWCGSPWLRDCARRTCCRSNSRSWSCSGASPGDGRMGNAGDGSSLCASLARTPGESCCSSRSWCYKIGYRRDRRYSATALAAVSA